MFPTSNSPLEPTNPVVAPYFFDWLHHRTQDNYWNRWAPRQYYSKITIPVLDFEGWYDAFLAGGVDNFIGMVSQGGSAFARANQRLVIGPWDHIGWGRPGSIEAPLLKALGPVADSPINELMLAWWDHYLKGVTTASAPAGPASTISSWAPTPGTPPPAGPPRAPTLQRCTWPAAVTPTPAQATARCRPPRRAPALSVKLG